MGNGGLCVHHVDISEVVITSTFRLWVVEEDDVDDGERHGHRVRRGHVH